MFWWRVFWKERQEGGPDDSPSSSPVRSGALGTLLFEVRTLGDSLFLSYLIGLLFLVAIRFVVSSLILVVVLGLYG